MGSQGERNLNKNPPRISEIANVSRFLLLVCYSFVIAEENAVRLRLLCFSTLPTRDTN